MVAKPRRQRAARSLVGRIRFLPFVSARFFVGLELIVERRGSDPRSSADSLTRGAGENTTNPTLQRDVFREGWPVLPVPGDDRAGSRASRRFSTRAGSLPSRGLGTQAIPIVACARVADNRLASQGFPCLNTCVQRVNTVLTPILLLKLSVCTPKGRSLPGSLRGKIPICQRVASC